MGIYDADIVRLRSDGLSVKEVARRLNLNSGTVSTRCKKLGISPTQDELAQYDRKYDDVQSLIDETRDDLEYIDGYINKRIPVRVRCRVCGTIFNVALHNIKYFHPNCPHCEQIEREERERERALQEAERIKKRERLQAERISAREAELERIRAERLHLCPVCGAETTRRKYCSDECLHKAMNTAMEHRRRIKIKENMVDKDITLPSLFKRDGGVCYICGQKCLYDDFTVVDGMKICGDWYPSIDHVIPLAKGGEHSWRNVKLAHRRCNILKSDSLPSR